MFYLKYFFYNIIIFAGLLSVTAQAQTTPHDALNGVYCTSCHAITGQGGVSTIVIPRGAEQERICKTCHNPDGIASGMSNVANHIVNGGTTIIECSSCHDPHLQNTVKDPHTGITAPNLSLIRSSAINIDNTLDALVFQETPDHLAFSEANAPWNGICQSCHTQTNHHTNDNSADHEHEIGSNCTGCHSHGSGFMPSGGGACDGCHGAPPATGAHLTHFSGTAEDASYGGTENLSTAEGYIFQCGTCHPLSTESHINGTVDMELYNAATPAGSLKSLNPPTAAYTPGSTPYTDAKGIPYTLGSCSNVYCHSETAWSAPTNPGDPLLTGGDPNYPIMDINYNLTYIDDRDINLVTESTVYSTVSWGDPPFSCNGCHRNPPQTAAPEVQRAVGNSHASQTDGPTGYEDLHTWNHGFDPLQCRTCHYNTVKESTTWTRGAYDVTYFDDVPIANKTFHVNGNKDVAFDTEHGIQYRNAFWLNGASYDPVYKTCSNVSCHKLQPKPQWGKPYPPSGGGWGSFECDQCHHYGGPWPTYSPASATSEAHIGNPQNCLDCHVRNNS
jgi:hypothetical protein